MSNISIRFAGLRVQTVPLSLLRRRDWRQTLPSIWDENRVATGLRTEAAGGVPIRQGRLNRPSSAGQWGVLARTARGWSEWRQKRRCKSKGGLTRKPWCDGLGTFIP